MLAPIMQLHPEILVEQEDTALPLFFQSDKNDNNDGAKKKWAWLVMGRIIYLCSPWHQTTVDEESGEEDSGRTIYYHENLAVLLALYREKVPQSISE